MNEATPFIGIDDGPQRRAIVSGRSGGKLAADVIRQATELCDGRDVHLHCPNRQSAEAAAKSLDHHVMRSVRDGFCETPGALTLSYTGMQARWEWGVGLVDERWVSGRAQDHIRGNSGRVEFDDA